MDFTPEQRGAVLDLARVAIRARLESASDSDLGAGAAARPAAGVDPFLLRPAGCFVSLHQLHTHRLRGCVGRLEATGPLVEVVRAVAVNVLDDPRFSGDPVRLGELAGLELEVSVLSPLQPGGGAAGVRPASTTASVLDLRPPVGVLPAAGGAGDGLESGATAGPTLHREDGLAAEGLARW